MENGKLVEHLVAVLALLNNLSHYRMKEKAGALVPKSLSEKRTKNILDIHLGVQSKIREPDAKRKIFTISVSRRRIEKPSLQVRHHTGMPHQEITTIVRGKSFQHILSKGHLEGPIEGAEKELFVLELNVQRNRMTVSITAIRTMGEPDGHQTSVGVHNKVGPLRVGLKHSPRRTATRKRVTMMVKESVTTRPILKTMTIILGPTRIIMRSPITRIARRTTKANRRGRWMMAIITRHTRSRRPTLNRVRSSGTSRSGGRRATLY
jgi:hypothetical protein